ncbi:sphingosine 1-phosphate receptor 5-like [Lethenteron reissneri]|uniref:sphingosine 1-phosphate receptor 5-like n=1 Tax=Lethenteron reissneri TaxID=7753 RepID=UPI002AB6F331|nr:sphingosine 1-phosphate receptor 5-like [Lethenteron reissneri]
MADAGPYWDAGLVRVHYNYTGKLSRPASSRGLGAAGALLLAVCGLVVAANSLVLASIASRRRLHTPAFALLANLALCDLLAGATFCANVLLSGGATPRGLTPALWFAREGSVLVALAASVFTLLAVALERHVTMARLRPSSLPPAASGGKAAGGPASLLAPAACWALALLLGALPSMGWNCLGALPTCSAVLPLHARSYLLFCGSLLTAALVAIAGLYARIYCRVRARLARRATRRELHPRSELASDGRGGGGRGGGSGRGGIGGAAVAQQQQQRQRRSSGLRSLSLLRTVSAVLCVFTACWAPLFVLFVMDAACGSAQRCPLLLKERWFLLPALLQSALNPAVCALGSRELRRALLRLLEATPLIGRRWRHRRRRWWRRWCRCWDDGAGEEGAGGAAVGGDGAGGSSAGDDGGRGPRGRRSGAMYSRSYSDSASPVGGGGASSPAGPWRPSASVA